MIHSRASFYNFVSTQVTANCAGIMTPELRAVIIVPGEPLDFPNCLNITLYDDPSVKGKRSNPAQRRLIGTFDLLVEKSNPSNPEENERQAYEAMHKINEFMSVQCCPKKNFSVNPTVSLGSNITWIENYPLEWRSSFFSNNRYIQKVAKLNLRYFEEKYS